MCMCPFVVKDEMTGGTKGVPCGRCPQCVKTRIAQWVFRLQEEGKVSRSSQFITLTYDTKHVPISDRGLMSFSLDDLQLFWKRLRKEHYGFCDIAGKKEVPAGGGIKYFTVAEYGDQCGRPHYHSILFNADIEKIQSAWQLGNVHYGEVTGASIGYTLKYMMKHRTKIKKSDARAMREFAVMSKGIGASYLNLDMTQYHLQDWRNRAFVEMQNGSKVGMPRYYRDRLYSPYEKRVIAEDHVKRLELERIDQEQNPMYYVEKYARDRAAFWKMYRQEKLNRTL